MPKLILLVFSGGGRNVSFNSPDSQASIQITYAINRKPIAKEIQPNQVLGRYEYRGVNDYDPATDFAAGKDTVIQVFLPDDVKAEDHFNATMEVYRNGSKVATLSNYKKDLVNNALIFIPPSRSSCGNWQAGTYKFVAKLGDKCEELTLDNVEFQQQRKLRVLAVPVKANYAGTIETPGAQWKDGSSFVRRIYPVAYDDFTYRQGRLFDASDASYDITTNAGQLKLWQALNRRQSTGRAYDQIIGFIEKGIRLPDNTMLQGYTYGAPSNIVVNSDQDMMATIAHEIAHNYSVGDEYRGGSVSGAGTYSDGDSVTAEAAPHAGYTFVNWTEGESEVSQSASYAFTVAADRNLTANFQIVEPTDECFIATAAFGSKFTGPVKLLRHFRDQYLLTNPVGTAFVKFYYHNSPPVAAVIADSTLLRLLVRLLLAPIVAGVYLLYHPLLLLLTGALLGLLIRRRLIL